MLDPLSGQDLTPENYATQNGSLVAKSDVGGCHKWRNRLPQKNGSFSELCRYLGLIKLIALSEAKSSTSAGRMSILRVGSSGSNGQKTAVRAKSR